MGGRAAWRYLHSMAANHPERATRQQQDDAQGWLTSFVQFYPCRHCAEAFVDICDSNPPRVASRTECAVWWCEAHNRVSTDLGRLTEELQRCEPARLIAAGKAGLTLD